MSEEKSQGIVGKIKNHLNILSEKAGIDSRLVIIGLSICAFFVFIGYSDHLITTVVGIAYPIFWSIRAIESPDSDDDKQWLTYWVVFALFSFIDLFSGFVLKFIPFYFFFKLLFLVWCFLPNFKGASIIYDVILIKIFKKYEKEIEQVGERIISQGNVIGKQAAGVFNKSK